MKRKSYSRSEIFAYITVAVTVVLFAAVGVSWLITAIASLASGEQTEETDGRHLQWDRFDVTIDNFDTTENRFDVTEDYTITVDNGSFRYGMGEIPLGRVESITDVQVYENDQPLPYCTGSSGTFCLANDGENFSFTYYFTSPMETGETRHFRVEYTVYGALRSYADGDELFWAALPGDLMFPVEESRVQVVLNPGMDTLSINSYPDTWGYVVEGNTLTWHSPHYPSDDGMFEVQVHYPHNPAMAKPDWQADYDRETWYIDNVRPFATLLLVIVSALVGIGAPLYVMLRYLLTRRNSSTLVIPEYLTAPPTDASPAIGGTLVKGKAGIRNVMAVLVDLARRGYVVFEQTQGATSEKYSSTDITFHRTEKPADGLRDFEQTLLRAIFPVDRTETKLSSLRNKFYKQIFKIEAQVYATMVQEGYLIRSPRTLQQVWGAIGIVYIIIAGAWYWFLRGETLISPMINIPTYAFGIAGIITILFAYIITGRTAAGAQQATLWRAFKRYLNNLAQYEDLDAARTNLEQYMPYAIAFGVEKDFLREAAATLTSMPSWYYPTYLDGPWQDGYSLTDRFDPNARQSDGSNLSVPNLSDVDHSLATGLNSLSDGMTDMLNGISRVLTSQPSSSGGSSGSSSSPGGSSGSGGSSGGGSRGFG
jgi:uncharacterized membrane protein YgcG